MHQSSNQSALIHSLALACVFASPAIFVGCSSTTSRSDEGSLSEIDPSLAYNRRQRAKAREHFTTATELQREGDTDGALAEYRTALELDDQLYAAWNNMGQLLMSQKNYADAVGAFQIASSIEPSDPRPMYNIGLAYQTVGWASDAYNNYENSLQRDPNYIPAMRGIARSAEMLGKGDRRLLEIIKQAQLRERDEKWRDYFRAQYRRVEILIDGSKQSATD